ncbi:MAG: histidinol-phosphatase [Clostridia bacterium]|nr:histidinol-phosphatase [Clostridia bacterium]MBR2879000.1 histidinol-phosphatase [Clostridia bacterium]MBR2973134.1 histidinol-phosphatase [Clostridia bacterium]
MLANFHTHTTFCDGKNTPEEIVLCAIENGFDAIGFSGHVNTPFDLSYCMQDTAGYVAEIKRLKEKYKGKLNIYLGIEEDMYALVNRQDYDYIIGSKHYLFNGAKYFSIDSSCDTLQECLDLFEGNALALAKNYYETFCNYILKRKPDIVGHFDLITKFEETGTQWFLNNADYMNLAERYISEVADKAIFEINTGAMARGIRKTPYPSTNLIYVLKKYNGKVILSSDSHSAETLSFCFEETKKLLRDIGFDSIYEFDKRMFKKRVL